MPKRAFFWVFLWGILTSSPAFAWSELKGDHFIVYYEQNDAFARQVAHNAEKYYIRIAEELGYSRVSNFWQWDKRVKIYVYQTQEAFQAATQQPKWSQGVAIYTSKEIHTFTSSEDFLNGLLPHEITHLIFRDFVGLVGQIPLWLDEGVAQWEEPRKRAMAKKVAGWLVRNNRDIPLQDLTKMNVQVETDEEKVHFFYMQSVSIVDFLVRAKGGREFTDFCRQLRDGKKFEDALRSVYGMANFWELQEKWQKDALGDQPAANLEVYS